MGMNNKDNSVPISTPLSERHDRARKAWIWLGVYALIQACFYVYFECRNALHSSVIEYPFLAGVFLFSFLGASLVLFIRSLIKRAARAAIIYAALFLICLGTPRLGTEFDL